MQAGAEENEDATANHEPVEGSQRFGIVEDPRERKQDESNCSHDMMKVLVRHFSFLTSFQTHTHTNSLDCLR